MLPLGFCPGFDVSGGRGGWNWKVIRAGCGGMGHRAGWNFWASFEWPHSQYLTTNVNGFSDWILC